MKKILIILALFVSLNGNAQTDTTRVEEPVKEVKEERKKQSIGVLLVKVFALVLVFDVISRGR